MVEEGGRSKRQSSRKSRVSPSPLSLPCGIKYVKPLIAIVCMYVYLSSIQARGTCMYNIIQYNTIYVVLHLYHLWQSIYIWHFAMYVLVLYNLCTDTLQQMRKMNELRNVQYALVSVLVHTGTLRKNKMKRPQPFG